MPTLLDTTGATVKLDAPTVNDPSGTRAALGLAKFVMLSSDQSSITSNTTLADVTGLAVTLAANTTYRGMIEMAYDTGATPDAKFGLTVPSGATGYWYGGAVKNTADTATNFTYQSIATPFSAGGVASGTVLVAKFTITIVVTTAGTLQVQAAQDTSSATATTVKAGSCIDLRPVT
jgi:hypothetical protein